MTLAAEKSLNMDVLAEFADLEEQIDDLTSKINQAKARKAELDPIVQEQLASGGVANIKVKTSKGNFRVIFPYSITFARYSSREEAVEALKKAGINIVTEGFNANTLSAYVRELANMGEELPREFEGVIWPEERCQARSRKS